MFFCHFFLQLHNGHIASYVPRPSVVTAAAWVSKVRHQAPLSWVWPRSLIPRRSGVIIISKLQYYVDMSGLIADILKFYDVTKDVAPENSKSQIPRQMRPRTTCSVWWHFSEFAVIKLPQRDSQLWWADGVIAAKLQADGGEETEESVWEL